MPHYDIAIIGAGSGGLSAAYTAVGFSKKVALIDKNKPGGECTWSGCVPSKALINISRDIHAAKKYSSNVNIDSSSILKEVRNVMENVYKGESPDKLKKDGIDYIKGFAKFVDKNTLDVDGNVITADKIIISTGSSPLIPNIEGLNDTEFLTNENIFYLDELPKSLIVLGGGAIGVELSQALNRLGVEIHLVEMMSTILSKEEPEIALELQESLIKEGLNIHTNSKALMVTKKNNQVHLTIEKNNKREILRAENILIAVGRKPNIKGLNLNNISVGSNSKGIIVDEYMRTTVKNIYAVGDISSPYQFSHMANVQAITAVQNAILPIKKKIDYTHVSWCTFTEPELARAGMREAEARDKFGNSIRIYTHEYKNIDRAKTNNETVGVIKLICDKKGKVIGSTILGERAGEIISEVQVVKTLGINFGKLSNVIHPYPTYGEVLNKLGKKVYVDNILNNPFVKFLNKFKK